MKELLKYVADDNTEFTEKDKCIVYETLCDRVKLLMSDLPEHPNTCDFSNGSGYIQHNKDVVIAVRTKLLDIISEYIDHKWVQESKELNIHPSYVGRLVGDYDIRPLSSAWSRINCINWTSFREYGQPYYTDHSDQVKDVCLNKGENK